MYSGYLTLANRVYANIRWCAFGCSRHASVGIEQCSPAPAALAVQLAYYSLGQSDCSAAWSIQLVDVMRLGHGHIIHGVAVHKPGKIGVDL